MYVGQKIGVPSPLQQKLTFKKTHIFIYISSANVLFSIQLPKILRFSLETMPTRNTSNWKQCLLETQPTRKSF